METKNLASIPVSEDEENTRTTMRHYRFNFRDVQHQYKPTIQFITAESVKSAVKIFVEDRRKEGWNNEKIFVDSLLLVIEEETQHQYVLNTSGELEIRKDVEPN